MDRIGYIKAIVNEDLVIVEVDVKAHLSSGNRLTVFTRVINEGLSKATGLEQIDIPKGEIEITTKQSANLYLAMDRFTILQLG